MILAPGSITPQGTQKGGLNALRHDNAQDDVTEGRSHCLSFSLMENLHNGSLPRDSICTEHVTVEARAPSPAPPLMDRCYLLADGRRQFL